jgi:hypothetical protein
MGDAYLFVFKVEVVDAFDFTIPSDNLSAEAPPRRAQRAQRVSGHRAQTADTEKPATGRLFLFLLYKFRISHGENKAAKYL